MIKDIIIKTIPLSQSTIDKHENEKVCVVSGIPYIRGTSLQSLCDHSRIGIPSLKDT